MNGNCFTQKRIKGAAAVGLLVSSTIGFFQSDAAAQSGRYDGWHPMMGGWGMGGFGMILNVAIWILAIVAIVWLVRWLFQRGGSAPPADAASGALNILNERYARGEIDKSQYEAMKRDIMAH